MQSQTLLLLDNQIQTYFSLLRLEKVIKDFPNQYITGLSPSMILTLRAELILVQKK